MAETIDLAVAVGEYTDRDGNTKTRWENIGKMVKKDDGKEFMLIKRTFNPAGVPNPENKDMVIVGMFAGRQGGNGNSQQSRPQQSRPAGQPQPGSGSGFNDFEDDIPF